MAAKLIDLSNGAKYYINGVREVVTITVSWGNQMVHYNNGVVSGSVPMADFVHGVWHDNIEPVGLTTDKKDIADLNNYGPDVSFVAVDEAESMEAYDDMMKAEIARPTDADEILQIAEETIAQRGVMYDSTGQQQERSMGKVVAMFNALTGHELTNEQGWKFMCLLKLARSEQGEFSLDSFIDLAAYAALAGEEAAKHNQQ